MKYSLITLTKEEELNRLYNDSAFTFTGFNTEAYNIGALLSALAENDLLATDKEEEISINVIKGKVMNEIYELTGFNQYPEDLNIVAIELKYLQNIQKLAIFRLNVDARWFDDVVNNNRSREND